MSKNIEIRYTWSEELFLEASQATYEFELKHSPRRFLGWFFIAMTQFGVVLALKQQLYGLLLISTLLVIYWYTFRWSLRKYMIAKSFASSNTKEHIFTMRANQKGIVVDGTLLVWSSIKEAVSLEKGFILYYGEAFLYIPKSAFQTIDEKDSFSFLLKESVEHYSRELN